MESQQIRQMPRLTSGSFENLYILLTNCLELKEKITFESHNDWTKIWMSVKMNSTTLMKNSGNYIPCFFKDTFK